MTKRESNRVNETIKNLKAELESEYTQSLGSAAEKSVRESLEMWQTYQAQAQAK
ncbi:MAG: hypothetical protein ACKV2Q_01820 [Planctomycetaceae bacterium]